jgi:23S rRNA (guanosine2251-2'-O)-methyltransferase
VTEVHVPAAWAQKSPDDAWGRVISVARSKKIPVRAQSGAKPQQRVEGGRVGVAEATVREREGISVEELFANAGQRAEGKGLWLALDSLQDPQNVGAIFRSAAFFGVQGILVTQERSAPLTATVYDVAVGGLESVPFTSQVNLQRAFEVAKEAGLWILGTSEHATDDLKSIQSDRPWLLVLGNEEKGMRRLTEEGCDVLCAVKPLGKVTSLNVSVAAGICISRLT